MANPRSVLAKLNVRLVLRQRDDVSLGHLTKFAIGKPRSHDLKQSRTLGSMSLIQEPGLKPHGKGRFVADWGWHGCGCIHA